MPDGDDEVPREFRKGDLVRAESPAFGFILWVLSEADARDLNDGESPLYPWPVASFALVAPA